MCIDKRVPFLLTRNKKHRTSYYFVTKTIYLTIHICIIGTFVIKQIISNNKY